MASKDSHNMDIEKALYNSCPEYQVGYCRNAWNIMCNGDGHPDCPHNINEGSRDAMHELMDGEGENFIREMMKDGGREMTKKAKKGGVDPNE